MRQAAISGENELLSYPRRIPVSILILFTFPAIERENTMLLRPEFIALPFAAS